MGTKRAECNIINELTVINFSTEFKQLHLKHLTGKEVHYDNKPTRRYKSSITIRENKAI